MARPCAARGGRGRRAHSLADDPTADGYDPADRAFAALDGLSSTAWVALSDDRPAIDLTFDAPRSVEGLPHERLHRVAADGLDDGDGGRHRTILAPGVVHGT